MWDLPGPGLKPVFPALAGGFLTTAPRGKSWSGVYKPDVGAGAGAHNHLWPPVASCDRLWSPAVAGVRKISPFLPLSNLQPMKSTGKI